MGKSKKVNVLGTCYEVFFKLDTEDKELKESDGYCDVYNKLIVIRIPNIDSNEGRKRFYKHTLAHELTHAFTFESGVYGECDWAVNEEVVDWIALQSCKINKAAESIDINDKKLYNK